MPVAKADLYYRKLHERRLNPREHVRKIVALSEIYGTDPVARAIEDAFFFEAFSCEYVTNLLQQRARFQKEPAALHLTGAKICSISDSITRICPSTKGSAMSEQNQRLDEHLKYLKLPFIREHYQGLAAQAAEKQLPHIDYLEKLADGEAAHRRDRSTERRIQQARFPGLHQNA